MLQAIKLFKLLKAQVYETYCCNVFNYRVKQSETIL